MKANEFFKEHGFQYTRNLVRDYPNHTHVTKDGRMFFNENTCTSHIKAQLHGLVKIDDLKRLVESWELVKKIDFWGRIADGLLKAKLAINNNVLLASYYDPSSDSYYRYGHSSLYVVREGKWVEVYVGVESLIHTDRLKRAIVDVESCQ